MVSDLTIERFRHREGQKFHIHHAEGEECGGAKAEPFQVELCEVDDHSARIAKDASEEGHRKPFSLVFRAQHHHALPSGIYTVTHSELGELDLFLTPVQSHLHGQTADAIYYEVTFG